MRIEELSIGDWVNQKMNDGAYQVQWIEREMVGLIKLTGTEEDGSIRLTAVPLSFIEPIPITAEILEKNGFEKTAICTTYLYNSDIEITLYGDGWWRTIGLDEYSLYRLDGVHQLQHALRLAGVEKEIEV